MTFVDVHESFEWEHAIYDLDRKKLRPDHPDLY